MTSISLDTVTEKVRENVCCHLIPCKISFNGPCNVSEYFTPHIREENHYLKCSLRGHPLNGQKIKVPGGYTGIILKENKKLSLSEEAQNFKWTGTFKEFTSWNWDRIPSTEDKLVKALQWLEVASVLHKPVSEYDVSLKESSKSQVKRKHSDSDS